MSWWKLGSGRKCERELALAYAQAALYAAEVKRCPEVRANAAAARHAARQAGTNIDELLDRTIASCGRKSGKARSRAKG